MRGKGWHHTEATKAKIRASKLGSKNPAKRASVRRRISKSVIAFFKKNGTEMCRQTKEGRKRISQSKLGKRNPASRPEVGSRISRSLKRYNRENGSHNLGMKRTEAQKDALSLAHIGVMAGKNHPLWNGGSTEHPYHERWTRRLRRRVLVRDNHTCRECDKKNPKRLSVHHINYDKKNCWMYNLISLCVPCHTRTNVNRSYWKAHFQKLMKSVETTRQTRRAA
jgi:hypothetical protein